MKKSHCGECRKYSGVLRSSAEKVSKEGTVKKPDGKGEFRTL